MDNNNAVTKEVPTDTKMQAIGTVKTVVGEVKAVDPGGTERILQAGDKVYPNETIMTAVGALVLIEFMNGTHLDLASASQIVLDSDVFDPSLLSEGGKPAGEGLTAEQIQEMIARGEDPTAVTEASAAGAGAGDEGGSSFIVVGFNDTKGAVTSGFNTIGIPGPESTTLTELPPVEDEAPLVPAVTVSVDVDVHVGEGEGVPGEGGVIFIPSGSAISGGVSGANVVEGSDGVMHTVTFLIKLSAPTTVPVTITYTIVPESATYGPAPDGDFFDGGLTKTVTVPAGFIGFLVSENIVADIKVEGNETFRIVLSNPVNATLTNDTATVTIIDDDMNPVANDDTNWVQEDNFGEGESVTTSGNVLQTVAHPGAPSDTSFSDTADADDNPLILTWGSEAAVYGSIVKNPDGTYTYTLNNSNTAVQGLSAGETLTETFTYTITDGVNTPDNATLTITIFGTDDGVTIRGIGSTQGDETVLESNLPEGSSPDGAALPQAGSFDIVALDGIQTVTIGDMPFTLAQVQAFNGTQVINTPYGALTLTGYIGDGQGGTISYSYTLDTTVDNDTQAGALDGSYMESIAVTVTDEDGSFSNSTLNINIVDDVPTAANDGPYGVVEDGTSVVSGNVLTNDVSGADVAKVFNGWSAAGHDNSTSLTELAKYGTLVQNGDGTWSYTLNNADPDTQALTAASNLSYELWYTMKDADGDLSPAKLTITITGANDNASVVTAQATGPDNTVFEAGLNPNGSNAAANSETSTGSFTVSATDGILNIVVGGTVYTLAQMQAFNGTQTVNTGEGVLTLTSYVGNAQGGTVNYSYTLSATIDNDSKAGATGTEFDDSLVLTVNGVGGTTASDNLVVRIVDDVPQATAALLTGNVDEDGVPGGIAGGTGDLAGEGTTASGSVATLFTSSADVPLSYSLSASTIATLNALGLKSNNVTVTYTMAGDTVTAKAGANTVFTFQLTAAGAYTFTLMDQLDHVAGSNENDLAIALGGIITAMDADGDTVTANASGLVITVDDDSPIPFTPTDGLLNNAIGDSVTESLNSLSKIGADNYGSTTKVIFDAAQEGNSGLTTAGTAINYYVSADGKTLTASTAGTEGSVSGANTVFTVQINDATDQYTVTMVGTIDNNSGSVFGNLSGTGEAGNPSFKIVESTSSDPLEILFTPLGTATSVNSDSDDVAVGSQFIIDGDGLRINFGKFHNDTHGTGTGSDDTPVIDESTTINGFRFGIDQISGGTTATMLLSVYDNQVPPPVDQNINNDVQDTIVKITVYNAIGTKIGDFTSDNSIGGVTVDFRGDGSVQIQGLQTHYSVATYTSIDNGYDSIKIYNDATNGTDGKFSLNNLQVEQTNAGDPVYGNFATILTDADGDTSTGSIDVTFAPAAAITGTSGADNMTAAATTGNDLIFGGAGNDILVGLGGNDVLAGGAGNDMLTGGTGRDTFVFTREALSENSADTVTDFTVGANGDVLDISDVLQGLGVSVTDATVGNYLKLTNDGTNTTVSIDVDGVGSGTNTVTLATIQGVVTDLSTLLGNGQVDHTP